MWLDESLKKSNLHFKKWRAGITNIVCMLIYVTWYDWTPRTLAWRRWFNLTRHTQWNIIIHSDEIEPLKEPLLIQKQTIPQIKALNLSFKVPDRHGRDNIMEAPCLLPVKSVFRHLAIFNRLENARYSTKKYSIVRHRCGKNPTSKLSYTHCDFFAVCLLNAS